jgi:hypothetical protein
MKICRNCKLEKSKSEFYPHKTNKDRLFNRCKTCERQISIDQNKRYRKANPERYKEYDLQKNFGISLTEYNTLLAKQNGVCAICKRSEFRFRNGKRESLGVDHSHITGRNRGLLCHTCNSAIGLLKDSPELLITAAQYLQSYVVD